jgi:hypothetical protein
MKFLSVSNAWVCLKGSGWRQIPGVNGARSLTDQEVFKSLRMGLDPRQRSFRIHQHPVKDRNPEMSYTPLDMQAKFQAEGVDHQGGAAV